MYPLSYFYENGLIPEVFKYVIPDTCECGSKLLLNDSMTRLTCSNMICSYHMSQRMDSMLKQLNVKDIGPSTCQTIIEENQLVHHTQVFLLGIEDMPSRNQHHIKEKYYSEIHKVEALPLHDVAKLLRAPDMQSRCDDIFAGYNDVSKFYEDFDYNEWFISKRLNMKPGKLTSRFTDSLLKLEPILRGLCEEFKLSKVASETIVICMTGDVLYATRDDGTTYKSREVLLKELQDATRGIVNIVNKKSMSQKVNYLITDTPERNTKKLRTANSYKIKPKVFTYTQFKNAMLNYADKNGGNE